MLGHSPAAVQLQQPRQQGQQQQQQQQEEHQEKEQQTNSNANSASTIERTMQAFSQVGKGLQSMSGRLQDAAELLAAMSAKVDGIKRHTSAANTAKIGCRFALDIVDGEKIPEGFASMVAPALLMPGMVATAAQACSGLISALTDLKQYIWAHHKTRDPDYQDLQEVSLASAPIQLLDAGLLTAIQATFAAVGHQRYQHADQSASCCALQHGADCTGRAAAAAGQGTPVVPAAEGRPCRSCMLAHAELLSACSTLLRYYPTCLLNQNPAATGWVTAAAGAALNILHDVSISVVQHQQQQQQRAAGHQPAAPPTELLQAGLAALDLLAAVCFAAGDLLSGTAARMYDQGQRCERPVLDNPIMLPSMLAATAAAVFGVEMQRRLSRNAAAGDGSNSSDRSSASAAAAAAAAAVKDQCGQFGQAAPSSSSCNGATAGRAPPAACSSSSSSSSDCQEAAAPFSSSSSSSSLVSASNAAWRLVCVTGQWSGGQLLPEHFTLLLESLGCCPAAFLWLACVWQQQQEQQQQQQASNGLAKQQQQQQGPQTSSLLDVLYDVSEAHEYIWWTERRYIEMDLDFSRLQERLNQRLQACVSKGQHQPQLHTAQHLYMGLLTWRWAVRSRPKDMFRPPEQDASAADADAAAAAGWQRHGRSRRPLGSSGVLNAISHATYCLHVWCCWASFEQQQQQQGSGAGGSPLLCGLGQVNSNAVLLEVLQGQCLLLREGARELQVVASSSSSCCSAGSDSESLGDDPLELEPALCDTDRIVARLLGDVCVVLRALLAAAAVNSRVLRSSAVQLFELAGTVESIVRTRGQCHVAGLVLSIDDPLLSLLSLLLFPEAGKQQQEEGIAAAAVPQVIQQGGLLPYLAVTMPLCDRQRRQLLGLLFSSLKLFSTYPSSLYTFSWSAYHQEQWLEVTCKTIHAACMTSTGLMARGQQGVGGIAAGSSNLAGDRSRSSNRQVHRPSSSAQQQQQQAQGSASEPGASCHSCGLGAEGIAALVPWLVLQGRALQLWVELFDVYVQLPPPAAAAAATSGKKAGSRSSAVEDQESQQRNSLVGSAAALSSLALLFSTAVLPTLGVLAAIVRDDDVVAGPLATAHATAENHSGADSLPRSLLQAVMKQAAVVMYGVPECMWPSTSAASLEQRLVERGQQLLEHCRTPSMDLRAGLRSICNIASLSDMASKALPLMRKSCDTLQELGDGAQERHRLRQSDIRRYLRSWDMADAPMLRDVVAMLASSKHSAVDVAIACWLCGGIPPLLLQLLLRVGTNLSLPPIHEACNNPDCRTFAGNCEQVLVCGKPCRACLCGGCRAAHYCSRACLKEHWPVHQVRCITGVCNKPSPVVSLD